MYFGACDGIRTGLKTFWNVPKLLTSIRSTNRTTPYLGHELWISCQNRDLRGKSQRNVWKFAHREKEFKRREILKIQQNWWKSEFRNSAFSVIRPSKFRRVSRKNRETCWNWCQKIFMFIGLNMIEYLSDLNEKWMVRKVSFCSFGPVWSPFWGRVQFPSVSANIRILEISSNFKKFSKFWNWRQRNFIFRGFYMVEYLSNLHEKLTVRKVRSCSFRHVLQSMCRTLCTGPVSK